MDETERPTGRVTTSKLSPDDLERLAEESLSLAQMVEWFKTERGVQVTREGVRAALLRLNSPTNGRSKALPWVVTRPHSQGWLFNAALAWGQQRAGTLPANSRFRSSAMQLEEFLRRTNGLLRYDPQAKPSPWFIRQRRKEDDPTTIFAVNP